MVRLQARADAFIAARRGLASPSDLTGGPAPTVAPTLGSDQGAADALAADPALAAAVARREAELADLLPGKHPKRLTKGHKAHGASAGGSRGPRVGM